MKQYKAIFFDWDGTAVISRRADPAPVIQRMEPLLRSGVRLVVISGTTYENIAAGRLGSLLPPDCLQNLYLGLGRGAYNYGFDAQGKCRILGSLLPTEEEKLEIDRAAFQVHALLWSRYKLDTDIVFSRPNYCKIDLVVASDRGESLFMQGGELEQLNALLSRHGIGGGVNEVIQLAEQQGPAGKKPLKATTDAKYLELGLGTKSDNVDFFLEQVLEPMGISAADCCFWGDEFSSLGPGIPGSDARMITDRSRNGTFFDVSAAPGDLPKEVQALGGQTERFLSFLEEQGKMAENSKDRGEE